MLARLSEVPAVESVRVDHSGELLELRVREPAALDAARRALADLGYEANDVDVPTAEIRWYDASSVLELSREEALIITERVLASSATTRDLDIATRGRLRDALVGALYGVFATHELVAGSRPGALREECIRVAEKAAAALVGAEGAREIGSILERDLA